jgi:hypothetical protein
MQKHRISTNIGNDQKVVVEIKQDYDLLEILSLKFTQTDIYSSMCSDYGVVCGRISVNNGFGVPNARVSIFIPVSEEDLNDPVISALYPFSQVGDKNDDGYRYNLLPQRKQHGGHAPTGTFPDQTDILTREEVLEVYEKYYKYTVKTNDAGDFMIWGVPLGQQTIHVDVDLSDIGCFSLRPDDFIRQGRGVDSFENTFKYKSSNDIDTLPQIISFDKNIEVYPFWGNEDLCEIGITRTDFDLSSKGVKIQPKAYFLGSIYSDQGKNTVNKECRPTGSMGRKCDLTTYPAVIEMIRFTTRKDENNRPILEFFEIQEDIDESGSFVLPLPMNLDYVFTNEFGENEITDDPNKGIPTSSCYRFRISGKNETLGRVRTVASYLIPNIREYNNDVDKSYAFSTDWTDYPSSAISTTSSPVIFNNVFGSYFPEDYFYRFTYNKVYGVSSYMGGQYGGGSFVSRDNFLGIKEISPKTDEDCESSVLTPPTNFAFRKFSFAILLAIIINVFEKIIYTAYVGAIQILILPFQWLYDNLYFRINAFGRTIFEFGRFQFFEDIVESLQRAGTVSLGVVTYPECESCDEVLDSTPTVENPSNIDPSLKYNKVGEGIAVRDKLTLFLECDEYQFNRPTTSGSTKFDYYDCDTNTFSTVTLTSGSTTTTRCVRRGTGGVVVTQISGGNGSAVVIGTCSTSSRITVFPNTCDNDGLERELYLNGGVASYTPSGAFAQSLLTINNNTLLSPPQQYIIKLTGYLPYANATSADLALLSSNGTIGGYNNLFISGYTCSPSGYQHVDTSSTSLWLKWDSAGPSPVDYVWSGITYEIYSISLPLTGGTSGSGLDTSSLPEGCKSYNTVYDENISTGTYCAANVNVPYSGLTITTGDICTSPNIPVGQILNDMGGGANACNSCARSLNTKSGFSEFRFGIFTIIPAAGNTSVNWAKNFSAIGEYARRKIVGKVFCEGISNYSFVENWLTGSLYMFPFKSKVRWDDEENLDLNYAGTRYCENLLYFKVQEESTKTAVKRFYYRSTKFNGTNFSLKKVNSDEITTLGHPTTVVDLGPRDEFIKEICVDPSLDPNCSVVRSVGATSFQSFKEMLGLYINYRMDTNLTYNYKDFFKNPTTGTTITIPLPTNSGDFVMNGDILQLISINNESGIQEFDLQDRNYGAYSPLIVDPDNYPDIFESEAGTPNGPLPINFALGQDGYRIRVCLNEPGRLTESSQPIPFFYWDKKGEGFGEGGGQFWDFGAVIKNDLQGMTYNYKFTGFTDSTYNYVLFPMTKGYTGKTFDGPDLNEGSFDEEDFFVDDHLSYDNQYEGFTYLYATSTGATTNPPFYQPTAGTLWTRVGDAGGWSSTPWSLSGVTYIIKPTLNNYNGNKQILSTPFLFYFGLRPGKTAVDKFIERFGPRGAFPSAE